MNASEPGSPPANQSPHLSQVELGQVSGGMVSNKTFSNINAVAGQKIRQSDVIYLSIWASAIAGASLFSSAFAALTRNRRPAIGWIGDQISCCLAWSVVIRSPCPTRSLGPPATGACLMKRLNCSVVASSHTRQPPGESVHGYNLRRAVSRPHGGEDPVNLKLRLPGSIMRDCNTFG
jgi:hypothetical protein